MEKYSKVIKSLALDLAKIPSIVGTVGEIDIANKVYERLSVLEYFKKNQQNLKLVDVKNDSLGRKYVLATIKPENKVSDTVLLLGHIDTVGIEDYGDLKNFATEPKEPEKKAERQKIFIGNRGRHRFRQLDFRSGHLRYEDGSGSTYDNGRGVF